MPKSFSDSADPRTGRVAGRRTLLLLLLAGAMLLLFGASSVQRRSGTMLLLFAVCLCLASAPPKARKVRPALGGNTVPLPTVREFTAQLGHEERVAWLEMPKYTETGYKLTSLPADLRKELQAWHRATPTAPEQANGHLAGDVRLSSLASTELETRLRSFLQAELERWTGQRELLWTNSYGPREYREGASLAAHSDRIRSHAISAIVFVDAEDLRNPWPLQFVPRNAPADARVHQVFLDADADVLLYESSLPHGRIQPLQGAAFAAVFFHWAPRGWRERAEELVGAET